jgi:hypothetical protein
MSEKAPKFQIHYNRELGKKYYCEKDYTRDLKARGLEPYRSDVAAKIERKEYKGVSDEARRMMASVTYDRKTGRPNIGDRYIEGLKKLGVRNAPTSIQNKTQGGWD